MRIALVSESFYPAVDGTTTTVRAVADRLVDTGHQVLVVAPGPGVSSYRGCPVARIAKPGRSEQVLVALADFGADLVHVASPGAVGRRALKHARALQVPTLLVQQTPVPELGTDYWRTSLARRADRVLVTARWMRGRLADLDVSAPVWSPGVDIRTFTPTLRDPAVRANWARNGEVLVGYVGSLRNRHDVRRLAERRPGARHPARGGRRRPATALARGAAPERALPRCRSRPGRSRRRSPTSTSWSTPGSPRPAATPCARQPPAAYPSWRPRAGGATDVVRPMESGLLHDPRDPRGLVRALAAVVADRHRALLGEHGRMLAEWRTWVDAVDELVTDHYLPAARGQSSRLAE